MLDRPARFVVDTHAMWWYPRAPDRLTTAASAVFHLAEMDNATIIGPAITVAEFYFLSAKLGQTVFPFHPLESLDVMGGIKMSDLGEAHI